MKIETLQPFVEPKIEKPCCASCKTFTPDCLVPVGNGALPMCWLCAHHVVEHNRPVRVAYKCECDCTPEEIYPPSFYAKREAAGIAFPAGKLVPTVAEDGSGRKPS